MYTIDEARSSDLPLLSAIELAAATSLAGHAPASVLAETTSLAELEDAQQRGYLWVARADDVPVGFAHVKMLEPGIAHLQEIDVHPEHGRRGLGRRLVITVCRWAATNGYSSVTLTTFRDVPWNMPFYARLGFEEIPPEELSPAMLSVIENETRRGMDPRRRAAMRRSISDTHIRRAQLTEHAALVMLWERSVRATHDFLAEADIVFLRPLVAEYFAGSATDIWLLTDEESVPIGFLGLASGSIAALFMDPAHRGQGAGRRLISHAQELCGGALTVDVNEQNVDARGFYEALGFAVVGRSSVDDMGLPFPILHMRREAPSRTGAA
jgi:putative acetyltransferase